MRKRRRLYHKLQKSKFFPIVISTILIALVSSLFLIESVHKKEKVNTKTKPVVLSVTTIQKQNIPHVNTTKTSLTSTSMKQHTVSPTPTLLPITPTSIPAGFCLSVPILYYHHIQPLAVAKQHNNTSLTVDPTFFDEQMQYISTQGYTTITTDQLITALRQHSALPGKSIVITLDDGYKDNYTYAYPIFQKYNLKANIMLATGLMEGADYLTWAQVTEMYKSGLVYYTDHTWSHYAMNHGTNEKLQFEIQTAKQQIESHTGQFIDTFTYPYGSFNDNAITLLQKDGFIGAFSTIPGKTQCESYIMALHRTRIGNSSLSNYGL